MYLYVLVYACADVCIYVYIGPFVPRTRDESQRCPGVGGTGRQLTPLNMHVAGATASGSMGGNRARPAIDLSLRHQRAWDTRVTRQPAASFSYP